MNRYRKDLQKMTLLEEKLKDCLVMRPDLHNKVLTADEYADYIQWMSDNFSSSLSFSSDDSIPPMLKNADISSWGHNLIENPKDTDSFRLLSQNFGVQTETHLFTNQQDIAVGQELRYMPPYWHSHMFFGVYYTLFGSCELYFDKEQITLTPGNVLIVPPSTIKAISCLSDDCVTLYYMLRSSTFSHVFLELLSSENIMTLFFNRSLKETGNTNYLRFDTGCDSAIEHLLLSIYQEYHSEHTYRAQMLNSLMRTFFIFVLEQYETTAMLSKKNDIHWKPEFVSIFQHIQNHYDTVTISDIAQKYNYSNRQIIRIIQNCTGKTFVELINHLKMEKAADMLRIPDSSISDVAFTVGYSTVSSFYRAFVKYYNCTPKEYIKNSCTPSYD